MYTNNFLLISGSSSLKAYRRAAFARHTLHIMPGTSILLLGGYREIFRDYLNTVFGENIILTTAPDLSLVSVGEYDYIIADSLEVDGSEGDFDANIGKFLNPGGGLVFFSRKGGG